MARGEKSSEKVGKSGRSKKVSVWNWMGTLILCAIPGVNLIALILFIILAKAQAKRSFAIAALILMVLALALVCAAFLIFPEELTRLAAQLRGGDAAVLITPAG